MLFYSKYKFRKHEKNLVRININGNLHFRSQNQVANIINVLHNLLPEFVT